VADIGTLIREIDVADLTVSAIELDGPFV